MNNKMGCGNVLVTFGIRAVRLSVAQLGKTLYDGGSR